VYIIFKTILNLVFPSEGRKWNNNGELCSRYSFQTRRRW